MIVTVLGRYAPYAPAGGAGPGYLIQSKGGAKLMLDGGPGTLARVQQFINVTELDAVLVSHLHEDHFSDLHSLQYIMRDALKAGLKRQPIPIYAPDVETPSRRWLEPVIYGTQEVLPLPVGRGMMVGDLAITFHQTDHPEPCWAIRINNGTKTVVYTADTGTGVDLAPFCEGADLLMAEATYSAATGQGRVGHMIAAETADLARRAGVKRLLLTHLLPSVDSQVVLNEARAIFPEAELAVECQPYEI